MRFSQNEIEAARRLRQLGLRSSPAEWPVRFRRSGRDRAAFADSGACLFHPWLV